MEYEDMEEEGNRILWDLISRCIRKNMRIAEVGCGATSLLNKIRERFGVEGICFDPYSYGDGVVKLPGERIHEYGEKYNIIYTIRSFHHLTNIEKFIASSYKSLKEEGYLIIVDWKKGTDTGVPENYYSPREILPYFTRYFTVKWGVGKWNFYILGTKKN